PGVTASGRDTKVTALVEVKPVYPKIALQLGEEGTVILTIEISDGGQVTDATVLQTSGFGSLDQAAIKAARGWRFQAAMQAGRAVASTVNIPFRFKFKRNQ
ncbi:MAG: energy transducer TonB, partial [Alphaproteobacteria bacterium]|nr:energy transducer TonB [Alphaproteobacteria bacterium]